MSEQVNKLSKAQQRVIDLMAQGITLRSSYSAYTLRWPTDYDPSHRFPFTRTETVGKATVGILYRRGLIEITRRVNAFADEYGLTVAGRAYAQEAK